jgi:hypothetical protein
MKTLIIIILLFMSGCATSPSRGDNVVNEYDKQTSINVKLDEEAIKDAVIRFHLTADEQEDFAALRNQGRYSAGICQRVAEWPGCPLWIRHYKERQAKEALQKAKFDAVWGPNGTVAKTNAAHKAAFNKAMNASKTQFMKDNSMTEQQYEQALAIASMPTASSNPTAEAQSQIQDMQTQIDDLKFEVDMSGE